MINEKLFVIQGTSYFEITDVGTHIVRKGIFMEDGDVEVEDILLTLCYKYTYDSDPDMGRFDQEWHEGWIKFGGCEKCLQIYQKEEGIENG